MHSVRSLGLVLVFCGLAAVVACEDDTTSGPGKYYAEAPFSFGFDLQARTEFSLQAVNGLVEISGYPDVQSVIVTGVRRVGSASMADAEAYLDSLSVEADSTDAEIRVWTDQPPVSDGREYIVDYKVVLPDDFAVAAAGANGTVIVRSLRAGVTIAFANASITGTSIEGDTRMSVANGWIETSVALLPGGRVALHAANGDIDLKIPVGTSAGLNASVTNGGITITNLTLTDEVKTPTSLSGTLGSGNGSIVLGVANGTILIEGF